MTDEPVYTLPPDSRLDCLAYLRAIHHGDAEAIREVILSCDPLALTIESGRLAVLALGQQFGEDGIDDAIDALVAHEFGRTA